MAMHESFWDEIGDTLFAVAMAAAIGIGAANLAVQVNKERAAFDAASQASETLGGAVEPPPAS
jgi:hypothetical protein